MIRVCTLLGCVNISHACQGIVTTEVRSKKKLFLLAVLQTTHGVEKKRAIDRIAFHNSHTMNCPDEWQVLFCYVLNCFYCMLNHVLYTVMAVTRLFFNEAKTVNCRTEPFFP